MNQQALYSILKEMHELRCLRCGKCCGRDDDPCKNLMYDADTGKYYCADYENRLGQQETVSGKKFRCVTIEEVKYNGYLPQGCGYR